MKVPNDAPRVYDSISLGTISLISATPDRGDGEEVNG
jgi:hypothetical protein